MEVDEIQTQVSKYQRIISNNSSNPNKLATLNHKFLDEDGGVGGLWPASRIVRVSRASGGKDRHSKVLTSKGLRDRRVRLSVTTAIQFYDLQDRLGYDQPSKAVEWLIKAAASSISELPSLDPSFSGSHNHRQNEQISTRNDLVFEDPNNHNKSNDNDNNNNVSLSCSSTSETSKGSGLSLSRSENRIRARERAREMAVKNKKDSVARVSVTNEGPQSASFTDLLTGGINSSTTVSLNNMDYIFNRQPQFSQFNHQQQHHFTSGGGGGGVEECYNLNFSIASSSSSGGGGGITPGFNRGTLQSNLLSNLPHNHHLQRFQSSSSSMVDGSTSTNFPFFIAPDHFPAYGGGDGGGQQSDYHKEKPKN